MNAKLYRRLLSLLLTALAGLEGKQISAEESVRLREMVLNLANANLMMEKQLKEVLNEEGIPTCIRCDALLDKLWNILYREE